MLLLLFIAGDFVSFIPNYIVGFVVYWTLKEFTAFGLNVVRLFTSLV